MGKSNMNDAFSQLKDLSGAMNRTKSNDNDQYNELNISERHKAERKADPKIFFNTNGNPFLGFMHFLQRKPVPKKVIDQQRLMADFADYAKDTVKTQKIILVVVIAAIACSIFLRFIPYIKFLGFFIMVALVIVVLVALLKPKSKNRYYTIDDYKCYVIESAISSQVEELVYEPHFGLPQSVFKDIHIIKEGNRYHTEDLVTGKYHNVYFVQSDLNIRYESDDNTTTYFRGQWVGIDYPKKFNGTVTIIDNHFSYGVKRKDLEKIELENPEFNNMFTVRASDMQLAYYLLTPQIMERLIYIKYNSKGKVVACFKDGILHIGINNGQDSFEPNIKNVNLYGDIDKFQYEFSLVSGLIEILKVDNNVYVQADEKPQTPYQAYSNPVQTNNNSGIGIQGGRF